MALPKTEMGKDVTAWAASPTNKSSVEEDPKRLQEAMAIKKAAGLVRKVVPPR